MQPGQGRTDHIPFSAVPRFHSGLILAFNKPNGFTVLFSYISLSIKPDVTESAGLLKRLDSDR